MLLEVALMPRIIAAKILLLFRDAGISDWAGLFREIGKENPTTLVLTA
jgi:hypothetical protein